MQMILTEGPHEFMPGSNLGSCLQGVSHWKKLSWFQVQTAYRALTDPRRRPPRPREPIPDHLLNMTPAAFE